MWLYSQRKYLNEISCSSAAYKKLRLLWTEKGSIVVMSSSWQSQQNKFTSIGTFCFLELRKSAPGRGSDLDVLYILWASSCANCLFCLLCGFGFLQDLSYKDRHWHETCFHCFQCKNSLVDKPFAAKEEHLLCTDCYSNEYSSKCNECKKTIMPGKDAHILG